MLTDSPHQSNADDTNNFWDSVPVDDEQINSRKSLLSPILSSNNLSSCFQHDQIDQPMPRVRRESVNLTVSLLQTIKKSVHVFRPSHSLANLVHDAKTTLKEKDINSPTAEIDVVISGGGLKGYFVSNIDSSLN